MYKKRIGLLLFLTTTLLGSVNVFASRFNPYGMANGLYIDKNDMELFEWTFEPGSLKAFEKYLDDNHNVYFEYDDGININSDVFIYCKLSNGELKYGLTDKTGNPITEPIYDEFGCFSEGFISAKIGDKWGFIDENGKEVVPFTYNNLEDTRFSDGLAPILHENAWGFIDATGKTALPFIYGHVFYDGFENGRAIVGLNEQIGYIDKEGNFDAIIFNGASSDYLPRLGDAGQHFDDDVKNYTALKSDDMMKNSDYEIVFPFRQGYATASVDRRSFTVINEKGEAVLPAVFSIHKISIRRHENTFEIMSTEGDVVVYVNGVGYGAIKIPDKINTPIAETPSEPELKGEETPPILSQKDYNDVPKNHWAYDAVTELTSRGILNGMGDGIFGINQNLTRAQFAAIIYRSFYSLPDEKRVKFKDVNDGDWYADAVYALAGDDIISGYPDGTFKGENPITREQMAAILHRVVNKKAIDIRMMRSDVPRDFEKVQAYAKDAVKSLYQAGVINGVGDNNFDAASTATRGQVAQMIFNFFEAIKNESPVIYIE